MYSLGCGWNHEFFHVHNAHVDGSEADSFKREKVKHCFVTSVPDPDPNPDPLVWGMDPRIRIRNRIHTKMSWIRNTVWNKSKEFLSIVSPQKRNDTMHNKLKKRCFYRKAKELFRIVLPQTPKLTMYNEMHQNNRNLCFVCFQKRSDS